MLRFFLELSVDSFHEPPNVLINTKRLLCVNSYEIMRLMMQKRSNVDINATQYIYILRNVHFETLNVMMFWQIVSHLP